MEIEAIKTARSAKKRRVTVLISKLKVSLQYGKANSIELKSSLEEEMDCLLDLDLQVAEIDGDSNYLESIFSNYKDIIDSFYASEKENTEIEKKKQISSLNKIIDRSLANIGDITERLKETLSLTNMSQGDVMGLEVDNKILIDEVSQLMEKVTSLGELTDLGKLEGRVDEVLHSTEQVKRNTAVRLRVISSGSPSADLEDGSPTHRKELFPSTPAPPPLTSLSPDAHSFTPSLVHSIASLSIVTGTMTKPSTSVGVSGTQGEASTFLPNTSSIPAPLNHLSGYSSANACASGIQGGSLGSNTLPSMSSGHMSYNVLYSMPVHSNHHSGHTTSTAYSMGTQGRDFKTTPYGMGPYPSGTSLGTVPFNQSLGHIQGPIDPGPFTRPDVIHTKRPSLPTFSGDRADWPEFRCVWSSMAESQFSNKVQLAMELKRCCKGKAADRVRHIYVTNEYAYEEIWERLREEYDDPGLSSQEAINRLRSLKPVSDQDFAGLVNVIDAVDSIFNQLRELNQLNAVHAVDVDSVSSCLPGTTHMEWLRKYSNLSPVEKMAPFGAFVAFLRRERTAVARLAETMPIHKRQVKKSSSHLGQGADRRNSSHSGHSGNVKTCAMHGGGHSTEDCRNFKILTIQQKYSALRKARRCFKCFEDHPWESCTTPPCSCGKPHHKMLCSLQDAEDVEGDENSEGGGG